MLRVEASNLPNNIKIPRSRRLLPLPPGTRRPVTLSPRPVVEAEPRTRPTQRSYHDDERWSVKLELGNEEIAKLYGQGMTRGAVVWRKGMVEWRPLLVTPELSDVLRRTRITLPPSAPTAAALADTIPPSAAPYSEVTLPRPARLPYGMLPSELADERVPLTTLAPMAADVEPSQPRARRPLELAAVALGAFALAWMGHAALGSRKGDDRPSFSAAAMMTPAAATPAPTACEPAATPTHAAEKSGIPTVAVADLPLASRGSTASASHETSSASVSHTLSSASAPQAVSRAARSAPAAAPEPVALPTAPSRADLLAAMAQVSRASSGCGERGGPVRVVMSFASSGVARSIQVSGSDLPASTRSCIISAASRARVGAFSGDPVTVSKAL